MAGNSDYTYSASGYPRLRRPLGNGVDEHKALVSVLVAMIIGWLHEGFGINARTSCFAEMLWSVVCELRLLLPSKLKAVFVLKLGTIINHHSVLFSHVPWFVVFNIQPSLTFWRILTHYYTLNEEMESRTVTRGF
jgi:hypothetical protein